MRSFNVGIELQGHASLRHMNRDFHDKSMLQDLCASTWYLPVQALPKTHLVVYSPPGQQVFVRTTLNNLSPCEDNDAICILDSA